uniref:Uncharacterized protein n=1 Tax=Lepeophtheirus salmonis TaxID=72036 RepID=A0A0K2V8P5_LEPSM
MAKVGIQMKKPVHPFLWYP